MPLEKLTPEELATNTEYVKVLRGLKVGEGGKTTSDKEGVGKITIKQNLLAAAQAINAEIKFRRSDRNTVIFEVVNKL